jgi:hypothetical protein
MMVPVGSSGFSQQIGVSAAGLPIYVYFDRRTNTYRYVVMFPDGKTVYSNERGEPFASIPAKPILPLAVLGGSVGFLAGGPVGVLLGALLGILVGENMGGHQK